MWQLQIQTMAASASVALSSLWWYHANLDKVLPSTSTLLHGGKCLPRQMMLTSGSGKFSRLLFINDHTSNQHYLVNLGKEVSVLPATTCDHYTQKKDSLCGLHMELVSTFGSRTCSLSFGNTSIGSLSWSIFVIPSLETISSMNIVCLKH